MWTFISPQNAHGALEHKKQQQESNKGSKKPQQYKNKLNTHAKT